MALENFITITENDGCQSINYIDGTGNYSASNLSGYGTPNPASSVMTSVTVLVLAYGYTTGYTFTFTLASNVITNATSTAPDGTITNIYSSLTSAVFPFSTAAPFVITGAMLGYGTASQIPSDCFYFEMNMSDGTTTYTSSLDYLTTCVACCCVRKMEAALTGDCDCEDDNVKSAIKGRVLLNSAIWAMEDGSVDKAHTIINKVTEICGASCNC